MPDQNDSRDLEHEIAILQGDNAVLKAKAEGYAKQLHAASESSEEAKEEAKKLSEKAKTSKLSTIKSAASSAASKLKSKMGAGAVVGAGVAGLALSTTVTAGILTILLNFLVDAITVFRLLSGQSVIIIHVIWAVVMFFFIVKGESNGKDPLIFFILMLNLLPSFVSALPSSDITTFIANSLANPFIPWWSIYAGFLRNPRKGLFASLIFWLWVILFLAVGYTLGGGQIAEVASLDERITPGQQQAYQEGKEYATSSVREFFGEIVKSIQTIPQAITELIEARVEAATCPPYCGDPKPEPKQGIVIQSHSREYFERGNEKTFKAVLAVENPISGDENFLEITDINCAPEGVDIEEKDPDEFKESDYPIKIFYNNRKTVSCTFNNIDDSETSKPISDCSGLSFDGCLERVFNFDESIVGCSGLSSAECLELIQNSGKSVVDCSGLSIAECLERAFYRNSGESVVDCTNLDPAACLESIRDSGESVFGCPGLSSAACLERIQNSGESVVDCPDPDPAACLERIQNSGESVFGCPGLSSAACLERIQNSGESVVGCTGLSSAACLERIRDSDEDTSFDDLDEVTLKVQYKFETNANLKTYIIKEELSHNLQERGEVPLDYMAVPASLRNPSTTYDNGPVSISIGPRAELENPPFEIKADTTYPAFELHIANRPDFNGKIFQIDGITIKLPRGFSLETGEDCEFTGSGTEYTLPRGPESDSKITRDTLSYICDMNIDVTQALGGAPFSEIQFDVSVDFTYEIEKTLTDRNS